MKKIKSQMLIRLDLDIVISSKKIHHLFISICVLLIFFILLHDTHIGSVES